MDAHRASQTAVAAASRRAYHYAHASPLIFADSLAHLLIAEDERLSFENGIIAIMKSLHPELVREDDREHTVANAHRTSIATAIMMSRARFSEDLLELAIDRGVRQYVIVGAGLDTFACRRTDLRDKVEVFEVDHPASQEFKRRRLEAGGISLQPNLHFVAADFEVENLADALSRSAFRSAEPAFFSWLGVVVYLSMDAILDTLAAIKRIAAPGSGLVFDYWERKYFDMSPSERPAEFRLQFDRAAAFGEPFQSSFPQDALGGVLQEQGFELLENLDPEQQEQRYFQNREDGLHAKPYWRLAHCRIRLA